MKDRKPIVNPSEAETVRAIFTLYARSSSTAEAIRELDARAILTKTGWPYDKTSLLRTLHNKVYRGLATPVAGPIAALPPANILDDGTGLRFSGLASPLPTSWQP